MEYIIMMVTHLIKTAAFFAVNGFPEIQIEHIPEAIEALFWQTAKITEIYMSMFF